MDNGSKDSRDVPGGVGGTAPSNQWEVSERVRLRRITYTETWQTSNRKRTRGVDRECDSNDMFTPIPIVGTEFE